MGVGDEDGGAHAVPPSGSTLSSSASRSPAGPPRSNQTKVSRLPFGPGSPDEASPTDNQPLVLSGGGDRADRVAAVGGLADHPAAPDALGPELELRLDHRQQVEPLARAARDGAQQLRQRDERDVDGHEGRLEGEHGLVEAARVYALHHGHAPVLPKLPVELAVADVDRDHPCGAAAAAGSR